MYGKRSKFFPNFSIQETHYKKRSEPTLMVDIMVTKLAFQAGRPGSILGRISTQDLKLRKKSYLYNDFSKWLDFRVFSDKDVRILGTSDPLSIGQ